MTSPQTCQTTPTPQCTWTLTEGFQPGVGRDIVQAYDACHDIGEALLAAYGYRTVNGPGQHEVLGRFLRAVFDHPPGQRAAQRFEQLRRSRNQQRYAARPVGSADAQVATQAAAELRAAAQAQGLVGS